MSQAEPRIGPEYGSLECIQDAPEAPLVLERSSEILYEAAMWLESKAQGDASRLKHQ